jgi:hypothetical protein
MLKISDMEWLMYYQAASMRDRAFIGVASTYIGHQSSIQLWEMKRSPNMTQVATYHASFSIVNPLP